MQLTIWHIFIVSAILGGLLSLGTRALRKPDNLWVDFLKNFVGVLFIISGLVKAIDPIGTALKMEEYFEEFARVFREPISSLSESLSHAALPFSVFMIVLEIGLGVAFIFGTQRKFTAWLNAVIIVFFTLLTGFTFLTSYTPGAMSLMLMVGTVATLAIVAVQVKNPYVRWGSVAAALLFLALNPYNFLMVHDTVNGEWVDTRFWLADLTHGDKYGAGHWKYDRNQMRVTDCGCFGDFIKLKPKISFTKDLILLLPTVIFLLFWKKITPLTNKKFVLDAVSLGLVVLLTVFCFYNTHWNEPVVDFRPFKTGTDLLAERKACMDNPTKVQKIYTYVNKQNGQALEITDEDFSKRWKEFSDTAVWKNDMTKMVEKVTKEGCTSKIKDMYLDADPYEYLPQIFPAMSQNLDSLFELAAAQHKDYERDLTGNDIISKLFLLDDKQQFLVVINDMKHANGVACQEKVAPLLKEAKAANLGVYCLYSGATADEAKAFAQTYQLDCPMIFGDEKLLKTMCRGNPAVFSLKQGKVLHKWHWRNIPTFAQAKL